MGEDIKFFGQEAKRLSAGRAGAEVRRQEAIPWRENPLEGRPLSAYEKKCMRGHIAHLNWEIKQRKAS